MDVADILEDCINIEYGESTSIQDLLIDGSLRRTTFYSEIFKATTTFLEQDDSGDFYWGTGTGNVDHSYQGPHWPRDKELQVYWNDASFRIG